MARYNLTLPKIIYSLRGRWNMRMLVNCHTSTPVVFSSVRETLRGRNSWPRKEELEAIVRRCRWCWRSPWEALDMRDWWMPPEGPLAGEVSLEALVDWKDTDMPESREPTLPRRTVCPTPSVNHTTTFTTSNLYYLNPNGSGFNFNLLTSIAHYCWNSNQYCYSMSIQNVLKNILYICINFQHFVLCENVKYYTVYCTADTSQLIWQIQQAK